MADDLAHRVHVSIKQGKRFYRESAVFMRQIKREFAELKTEMAEHRKFLGKVQKVNEAVDETLCKVLLAIRQNEYLQAWYPEKKNGG